MPERFNVGNPNPLIETVVADMSEWLQNPASLAAAAEEMNKLRLQIQSTGATRRTAEVILGYLDRVAGKTEMSKAA